MPRFEDYVSEDILNQLRQKQKEEDEANLSFNKVPGQDFSSSIKNFAQKVANYNPMEMGRDSKSDPYAIDPTLPPDRFLGRILNKAIGDEKPSDPDAITESIGPLDLPTEAATLAGAGIKGLAKSALAGRKALYTAIPKLAEERGSLNLSKNSQMGKLGDVISDKTKQEMQSITNRSGAKRLADEIKAGKRSLTAEEIDAINNDPELLAEFTKEMSTTTPNFTLVGGPKNVPGTDFRMVGEGKFTPNNPAQTSELSVVPKNVAQKNELSVVSKKPEIVDDMVTPQKSTALTTRANTLPEALPAEFETVPVFDKKLVRNAAILGGGAMLGSSLQSEDVPVPVNPSADQTMPEGGQPELPNQESAEVDKTQSGPSDATNAFSEALGIDAERAQSIVEQLKKAQEQAKQDKAQSRLMMAANKMMRGALGKSYKVAMPESSNEFWKDRMKDADQGVKDIATLHEAEKEDPDSPISKRMREIMGPVFEKLNIKAPEKMSYSMLKENFPQLVRMYDSQILGEQETKQRQQKEARVSDKQTKEIDEFDSGIQAMENVLDLGTNEEGKLEKSWIGPVDRLFPDVAVGAKQKSFRQAVGRMTDAYRKLITGAAAGDKELLRLESRLPSISDTPEQFEQSAKDFIKEVKKAKSRYLGNLQKAGKNVEAWKDSMQIDVPEKNEVSVKDQQAIEWAKKNPNDERAKKILKLHGI